MFRYFIPLKSPIRGVAPNGTVAVHVLGSDLRHRSWNFLGRGISLASSRNLTPDTGAQRRDAQESVQEVLPDDLPLISADDHKISIGWTTQMWSRFHNIWLRDHCRCPQCFHPITKQRLVKTSRIPLDIKSADARSNPNGLEVTWESAHVSFYPWSWLQRNSYDPKYQFQDQPEKVLWGAKIQQRPPSVTYDEIMSKDERGLFKWLTNISRFGFSFVSGVPETPQDTERLATRIGFIRETQYGKFWDFTSNLAKGDTAYTTLALEAHTDNTYFTDPCGLQLFHLLSHTDGSGGATLLVDGFYVAAILKELHPEAYSLLSRIPIPAHAAVLNHDPVNGGIIQVRWNNDDRSAMNHLDPQVVTEWYNAIRTWHKFLTSPDSEYWVQLSPGTAVVVDNHRVLHGRSAFDGKRRMCGAYIGVDEYQSKLAILQEKFAPDTVSQATGRLEERSVWNLAL